MIKIFSESGFVGCKFSNVIPRGGDVLSHQLRVPSKLNTIAKPTILEHFGGASVRLGPVTTTVQIQLIHH